MSAHHCGPEKTVHLVPLLDIVCTCCACLWTVFGTEILSRNFVTFYVMQILTAQSTVTLSKLLARAESATWAVMGQSHTHLRKMMKMTPSHCLANYFVDHDTQGVKGLCVTAWSHI